MQQRNTIQCSIVLGTINRMQGHRTADEIYSIVSNEHPTISRATVYRNLNRLSSLGKIRKFEMPGGADRYERQSLPHYHVKCEVCGEIFDVDMEYMEDLEAHIRDRHGFRFTGHDLVFSGICPACQEKQAREDAENTSATRK